MANRILHIDVIIWGHECSERIDSPSCWSSCSLFHSGSTLCSGEKGPPTCIESFPYLNAVAYTPAADKILHVMHGRMHHQHILE